MKPLVSVVIPSYNMAAFTPLTVESVLAQDYPAVEVIVVDDGSSDGSVEALRRFGGRIKVIEQKNAGACAARNRGLKESRGEFIAFLDCDDLWEPSKLSECVAALRARPEAVMVHSLAYWIDAAGKIFGPPSFKAKPSGRVFDALSRGNFVVNSTPLSRTEAVRAAGGWDEAIFTTADWDMWLRLAKSGEIAFIPRILARTRVASYYNARNIEKTKREWIYVLDKHKADLAPGVYEASLGEMGFYLSRLHSANDDFTGARAAAAEGLRAVPGSRKLAFAGFLYGLGGPANRLLNRLWHCYTILSCRWNILRMGFPR
ncbi:MAG: glycosyltransferase [Elusimicrobia bacterium]|nr:glycosyltransferase [Elusimicrobiota bacterium]